MAARDANDIHRDLGVDGLRAAFDESLGGAGKKRDQASERPPSPFVELGAFIAAYEPLSYRLDGIVRSSSLYTLTAKTGHGKTGFLVNIALACASGIRDLMGRNVEPAKVAYVAVENPDDLRMRMAVTAFRFNLSIDELTKRILILDHRMKPEDIIAELARLSASDPFGLVIIDTLAALFDGKDINDAVQGGEFMRRLRPLTRLPGLPSAIVAAHPVKNATGEQLIPYGSGAILNEVDGNLTLWKPGGIASMHWQGKLRGLDFEPLAFKFENCASPDILDSKGRQVEIKVCIPTTEEAAEQREAAEGSRNIAVLKAIAADPKGTQRQWIASAGLSGSGALHRVLEALTKGKFVEKGASGQWRVTRKGEREIDV